MRQALLISILAAIGLGIPRPITAAAAEAAAIANFHGPKDAVILIIRHAEKPESGIELSPAGYQRAAAYPAYFRNFKVDSQPVVLDAIYATADSKNSRRPRLTVEPLGKALRMNIHDQFKNRDFAQLAAEIASKPAERKVLICWHHGEIPGLLEALGADPARLLPNGKWPSEEFGWVLELRYDQNGRLLPEASRRIVEDLQIAARP